MAKIVLENLSREEALRLLENVRKNATPQFSVHGKKSYRYVYSDNLKATVSVSEENDYTNNTFEISSNYWVESSLKQFAEL